MIDLVKNFLFEYFWLPIVDQSVHYNVYNTTVYALLFAITAIYLVFPLVKKVGLSFDKKFFIAIAPYVFLGGLARSLRDLGIIDSILLETPIIYIILFTLTSWVVFTTYKMEERSLIKNYSFVSFGVGIALVLYVLVMLLTNQDFRYDPLANFAILLAGATSIFLILTKFFDEELISYSFIVPIVAHYADSASTVAALELGAEEKHVLANFFIDLFGPFGMFIMKSVVIIPVVFYLVKEFEGEKRNYYLFLVTLLGLALAVRNMTSVTFV